MDTAYHSLLVVSLAFVVGYSTSKGTICVVIAAKQLALRHRASRMVMFAVAACMAGGTILPLTWYMPDQFELSLGYPITTLLLLSGAMFAVGAYINDACAFGTLAHLSAGDSDYAGTIIGVVLGAICVSLFGLGMTATPQPSPLTQPLPKSWFVLAFFAVFVVVALWRYLPSQTEIADGFRQLDRPWHPSVSMVLIGVAGGLLHATAGEWTYMATLSQRTIELFEGRMPVRAWSTLAASFALLAGGISAAVLSGEFNLKAIQLLPFMSKIIGGALMGASATIIPGGNDVMLLYGVPSLALHAIAAYLSMTVTLITIFSIRKRAKG